MSISSSNWGRAIGICFIAIAMLATAPITSAQSARAEQSATFDIPAQDLATALTEFARQSGQELFYLPEMAEGKTTDGVSGTMSSGAAMDALLDGTGLEFERTPNGSLLIGDRATLDARRAEWQSSAAGQQQNTIGQRRPGIEEIIVTGQKKEERIQDVPIAISAFTQEDLTTSQIAGGPDLHLQVPNMTFTKTNFTGYSIQIRGIGTQAISATTDPAVAVALNQTPFIRNRFFEQEFYDLERLEVLRGPQGTLFGRNATAGVVNLISAKPKFQDESMLSLDMGNYDSRRWEFMINKPLVDDRAAFRLAAAGTKRDGYAKNELTDEPIDGRDLWSTRASLRFAPNDNLDINLIWEHFEEDDDRLRSGKQLCKTDEVTEVAGYDVGHFDRLPDSGGGGSLFAGVQATFSQGCERHSLYSENSFQTPNGLMLPYYVPLQSAGLPNGLNDPYVSRTQSYDLRVIESTIDPEYRARSDIGQIQIDYQLTDGLLLESETAYMSDEIYSLQDFNRFNTARGAWLQPEDPPPRQEGLLQEGPVGGIFCDPQLGCADRLVAADVSTAESSQFSQELRLSSQFGGPFNFSVGANFLRYDTVDKYYVFVNSLSLAILRRGLREPYVRGATTNTACLEQGLMPRDPDNVISTVGSSHQSCTYVDPNPIGEVNDLGHNYFLSKNPFNLRSYAVFGESYWNVTDSLKLTAGLRWSVDNKRAPLHPSWLFVEESVGHPEVDRVEQTWREPTGRLVLDWQPALGFTDETLIYGSVSRGYKAGGANPPLYVPVAVNSGGLIKGTSRKSATRPQTFDAEFVNAFEVGTKNTLADGALTLNAAAFYYDYTDYQISEIVDRSAFNKNYDVDVWGLELEADWWVRENLRLNFKGGYQKTRIADGEQAIDLMNRTADGKHLVVTEAQNPNFDDTIPEEDLRSVSEYVRIDSTDDIANLPADQEFVAFEDWTLVRPFPTSPSSCILPTFLFDGTADDRLVGLGNPSGGGPRGCELAYLAGVDPVTRRPYQPFPPQPDSTTTYSFYDTGAYPGFDPATAPNGGEGIAKDLSGNELPNAPNYTATLSADYVVPLSPVWTLNWHTDLYWQSESWWRIFNDHEYNRLDDYFTMNLAAILKSETGWNIMAYIKNVTDEDAITGAFLGSDDTALTTNVFLVEPRLYGLRVTRRWDGGGGPATWLGGAGAALLGRAPGEPNPWELTVGGQLLRPKESGAETFAPAFISTFDPDIDPSSAQGDDLDWGDGREIVLTYAPDNGWRFSLGARFGESNRSDTDGERIVRKGETVQGCILSLDANPTCEVEDLGIAFNAFEYRTNYGLTELTQDEEHLLVDFTVGRDVGLGALASTVSAGLRYARFKSRADISLSGTPDWNMAEDCLDDVDPACNKYAEPVQHNEYAGTLQADREFEGIGPVVGWEASARLWDDARGGHVDLDWSLSGGVLFGKQKTEIEGAVAGAYFDGVLPFDDLEIEEPVSSYAESFSYERDTDAAVVPTAGAGLGLTYRIDGFSVGAGYQWERYFSVIDGGIAERKEYDRTVDGPYLKVTFGGGS